MTDTSDKGERIAKAMARAGVASRRDAEKMIVEGRVKVNGKLVESPALDVLPTDRITLDGKPIDAPQETRLWLYYKPLGLVTSEKDEKGRQTVFDTLPKDMPRVMSIGRLDMNSEGLLLLTNDGGLKRRLELPATGWLRKYRVRVNGQPNNMTFDPLRRGITVEGEEFQPMEVSLDRQQGANAWLTVGIREGKNREVRRAMAEVKLVVNRLIRISYGPFRLNEMKPGDVIEVRRKVLREQLGWLLTGEEPVEAPTAAEATRPFSRDRDEGPRKPRHKAAGERPARSFGGEIGGDGERPRGKPAPRDGAAPRRPREAADGTRPAGAGGYKGRKDTGERPHGAKPAPRGDDRGAGKPAGAGGYKGRKDAGDRPHGAKPAPRGDDRGAGKPAGAGGYKGRKDTGDRPHGAKPAGEGRAGGTGGRTGGRTGGDDRAGGKPAGGGYKGGGHKGSKAGERAPRSGPPRSYGGKADAAADGPRGKPREAAERGAPARGADGPKGRSFSAKTGPRGAGGDSVGVKPPRSFGGARPEGGARDRGGPGADKSSGGPRGPGKPRSGPSGGPREGGKPRGPKPGGTKG